MQLFDFIKNNNFHDWLLLKIDISWEQSSVTIFLKNTNSELCYIRTEEFFDIHVPKLNKWGKSISILDVQLTNNNDKFILEIQMQSGDSLRIIAKTIELM